MIIRASQGCYLTQADDSIELENRLFVDHVSVGLMSDISKWKEITAKEKEDLEYKKVFFDVNSVDVSFLHKVDGLHYKIANKINDAHLTNAEALEMQQYYPKFEDLIGKELMAGFKFECDGVLFEVVKPHVVTAEMRPSATQPMLLNLAAEDDPTSQVIYYKPVTPEEVTEPTEPALTDNEKDENPANGAVEEKPADAAPKTKKNVSTKNS